MNQLANYKGFDRQAWRYILLLYFLFKDPILLFYAMNSNYVAYISFGSLYFRTMSRIFHFVVCIEIDQLFIVTFYNQLASPVVIANNKLFIV